MSKEATRTKGSTRRTRPSQKPASEMIVQHDDIARRAFEIYLSRGAIDGDALGDWVQAERELIATH